MTKSSTETPTFTLLEPRAKTALYWKEERVSYVALLAHSEALAAAFPMPAGARAVLFAENRPEWLATLHAIWRCGGVVVPVDSVAQPDELAYIVGQTEPVTIFCSQKTRPVVDQALAGLAGVQARIVSFDEEGFPPLDPAAQTATRLEFLMVYAVIYHVLDVTKSLYLTKPFDQFEVKDIKHLLSNREAARTFYLTAFDSDGHLKETMKNAAKMRTVRHRLFSRIEVKVRRRAVEEAFPHVEKILKDVLVRFSGASINPVEIARESRGVRYVLASVSSGATSVWWWAWQPIPYKFGDVVTVSGGGVTGTVQVLQQTAR